MHNVYSGMKIPTDSLELLLLFHVQCHGITFWLILFLMEKKERKTKQQNYLLKSARKI